MDSPERSAPKEGGAHEGATKERILATAAHMFSERGYDKVTMREIAKDIGINPASIYHHFVSKEEILSSLYHLYTNTRVRECPDLGELLRLAETEPPLEVLMKTEYHFGEEATDILDQIVVTASRMVCSDPQSERFIKENIFDNIAAILKPVVQRLIDLRKIEPFDTDNFFRVLTYYCFAAAALNNSTFMQSVEEYQAGLSLLFSMIKPTSAP